MVATGTDFEHRHQSTSMFKHAGLYNFQLAQRSGFQNAAKMVIQSDHCSGESDMYLVEKSGVLAIMEYR